MSRRPNIHRPVSLHVNLPEDIRGKLDLYLYSPLENRVPVGAYSKFICERVREFFEARSPDVKPRY